MSHSVLYSAPLSIDIAHVVEACMLATLTFGALFFLDGLWKGGQVSSIPHPILIFTCIIHVIYKIDMHPEELWSPFEGSHLIRTLAGARAGLSRYHLLGLWQCMDLVHPAPHLGPCSTSQDMQQRAAEQIAEAEAEGATLEGPHGCTLRAARNMATERW